MKNIIKYSLIFTALLLISCEDDDVVPITKESDIRYKVTFTFDWSEKNFPTGYPDNAHFSKLIGWSHDSSSNFFQPETEASLGIEEMAETGATNSLVNELNNRINNNEGHSAVVGSGLGSGEGTITIELNLDKENTSITLATMIAPSPDWYVAVVNVNLFEDDDFVLSKTVDAHVYDSGTDSGTSYTSADKNTDPKETITLFLGSPFGDGTTVTPAIAKVSFVKVP